MKIKILVVTVLLTGVIASFGQGSSRFTLTRSVIAGGGTTFSASSRFQLGSTVAQPLAAVPSSGRFSILGGFWIWPAPIIFAPAKVGNNFTLSFQSDPGKTYLVQYTDTIAPPHWQNLPLIPGDGSVQTVTNSAPDMVQRYYRLIEQH